MTREEADFIGSMNMCDEISNEAYKKIMCHCEEQEQTSWIPVSERLPEDAQTVLVTRACRRNRRRHHFVETGEIIGGTWISPNDEYRIEVDSYTVIAWMPLPEPYKAESEEKKEGLKYCDRNICVSNEYSGIGCDECMVNAESEVEE